MEFVYDISEVRRGDLKALNQKLMELGVEGWELVAVVENPLPKPKAHTDWILISKQAASDHA